MATATRSGFGRTKQRGARDHAVPGTAVEKGQVKGQTFRVAGVQMASGPSVAANLNEAGRLIEIAVSQGARLVALPEYFAIMGMRATDKVKVREKEGDGPIQRFLAETAKKHKIWLVGCSVPVAAPSEGKIYNSCQLYDDSGKMAARYDKIHLFSLDLGQERFSEEGTLEAGQQGKVVDSPFRRIRLVVLFPLPFLEPCPRTSGGDIIL